MALDYKIVGRRIKKARIKKGYTQAIISKKLGVSTAFISRVERGTGKISLKRLSEMSEILGTPISRLLSGTLDNHDGYLGIDFKETLEKCNPERKRAILEIANIIAKL